MFTKNTLHLKSRTYSWFTLVELIVVITILVILWTIAFTSLSGFSGGARDSSRVSDLTNLSKALDIVYQKTGSYPTPDNSFTVTYSGWTLWTQGTIWDTTLNFINAWWTMKMSKKPTDPLTTNKEYTYSKLFYWNAYQIKSDWEGDSIALSSDSIPTFAGMTNFGFPQASAATGNPTLTYIKSNYNGMVVKTESGSTKYLIAVPSLFLNTNINSWTITLPTGTATGFYIHSQTNSGWVLFAPQLVFSSGSLPSNNAERITFASGIANAYSGTILSTNSNIAPFISALTATNSGALLASLGGGVVSGSLWGGTNSTNGQQNPPATPNTTASCISAWTTLMAATTYPGTTAFPGVCDTPDTILCTGAGTGQIWSMCNVGATTTTNYNNTGATRTTLATVDGKLFQFARNDGFDTYSATPTNGGASSVGTGVFIGALATSWYYAGAGSNRDWRTTQLSTITNASQNIWTTSPCDTNYHVPTQSEFQAAYNTFSNTTYGNVDNLPTVLKMPYTGSREATSGSLFGQGSYGSYWSSSPCSTVAYGMFFNSSAVTTPTNNGYRADASSVRCLKN